MCIRDSTHFTDEHLFKNDVATYLANMGKQRQISILDGSVVGVKTISGKPIILDQLMEQQPLDFSPNCLGIYIPSDEILKRTKYQWFAALPEEDVMNSDCVLTKMMLETLSAPVKLPMIGDVNRSIASI